MVLMLDHKFKIRKMFESEKLKEEVK